MSAERSTTRPSEGNLSVTSGSATALGGRPDNQDRSATGPDWAVVSDGIGGYAGGAKAAQLTVDWIAAALDGPGTRSPDSIVAAIQGANDAVRLGQRADPDLAEMGATVTVAAAVGDEWVVANLGDSPAWLVRDGAAEHLAETHNVAGELIRRGTLDPSEAADHPGQRILLRGVGLEADVAPAVRTVEPQPGDRLIVASDGLAAGVDPGEFGAYLDGNAPDDAARRLVDAALAGGATDNVTVVVIAFDRP